jgi:hypothetical protein
MPCSDERGGMAARSEAKAIPSWVTKAPPGRAGFFISPPFMSRHIRSPLLRWPLEEHLGVFKKSSLGLCFCIVPQKLGAYPNFVGRQHGSRLSVHRREGVATMTGEEAYSRSDNVGKPEPAQMAGNFLFMVLDRGVTPIVFEHLRNCLPTAGDTSATLPYRQKKKGRILPGEEHKRSSVHQSSRRHTGL